MHLIKNITLLLLFLLLLSFNQSCDSRGFRQRADSLFLVTEKLDFKYNLKQSDDKYFMPYVLEEISGLTFKKPNSLLAVDDESGKLFQYDLTKKQISHSIGFHKSGDYEGIEIVGETIYILKSDGDLFKFKYGSYKETKASKFENELSSKNDTEGLGYNEETLIIACKEDGGIGENSTTGRSFYTVNLTSMELNEDPVFTIGPAELVNFWSQNRNFKYQEDRVKFKPSAIAVHPISKNYYILSSVGKMLVIVNKSGEIQGTYPISPQILGQPEGLCFSPKGDMYISSEGEGDRGYILKFEMKKS